MRDANQKTRDVLMSISHHILGLGTACGQGWYHWKSRRTTYLGLEIHAHSKPLSAHFYFVPQSDSHSQAGSTTLTEHIHCSQCWGSSSSLFSHFVESSCSPSMLHILIKPLKLDVVLLESFEYYVSSTFKDAQRFRIFGLAESGKMAVEETIVSQLRFGLVFDNRLWRELLVSLIYH